MTRSKDKYPLYLNAFKKAIARYVKELDGCELPDLTKVVFYGIQTINHKPKSTTYEESLTDYQLFSTIKSMIAGYTPNEFMNLFPVSKVYDGDRYEIKDYFYTMDHINSMNKDEPIGEKVLEFLIEYTNPVINVFNVKGVMCVSDLRQYEGHLCLMEEFIAADGHDTPNTFKNTKGESMYVRRGKPTLVEKIESNKLELVK